MKKLTLLFFALFIVFLLSACADITTLTIDFNNTQSKDTLINVNDVENTTITSNDSNSIISELESLINELKNQVSELKKQNDSLTSQIESLSNELDELKEENKTHNSEILELNNEIEKINSEKEALQKRITYLEDERKVGLTSNYNKVGQFYEKEVNDMVDCSQFYYASSSSSLGVPILIDFPEDDVCFICEVEDGVFYAGAYWQIQREKKIVLYPEPNNYWYLDDDLEHHADTGFWWASSSSNNQKQQDFIQVIITKEDHIIGYAVIKIQILGPGYGNAITLKSVVLPKIGDEYQNVTLEQVQLAINAVILLNTPVEEE